MFEKRLKLMRMIKEDPGKYANIILTIVNNGNINCPDDAGISYNKNMCMGLSRDCSGCWDDAIFNNKGI